MHSAPFSSMHECIWLCECTASEHSCMELSAFRWAEAQLHAFTQPECPAPCMNAQKASFRVGPASGPTRRLSHLGAGLAHELHGGVHLSRGAGARHSRPMQTPGRSKLRRDTGPPLIKSSAQVPGWVGRFLARRPVGDLTVDCTLCTDGVDVRSQNRCAHTNLFIKMGLIQNIGLM